MPVTLNFPSPGRTGGGGGFAVTSRARFFPFRRFFLSLSHSSFFSAIQQ
jgi:hypothetical protein